MSVWVGLVVTLERVCHCLLKSGTTCSQLVLKANPSIPAHGSQVRGDKSGTHCPIFIKRKVFVELFILDGEQKVLLCHLIDLLRN